MTAKISISRKTLKIFCLTEKGFELIRNGDDQKSSSLFPERRLSEKKFASYYILSLLYQSIHKERRY